MAVEEKKTPIDYLPLFKAAASGNWKDAEEFLNCNNLAPSIKITDMGQTVLHIAVFTGSSMQFIRNLADMITVEIETLLDHNGETPLHYAAHAGNTKAAEILYPRLIQLGNKLGFTPIHSAAKNGHKETVSYLISVTPSEDPFMGKMGVTLINLLIVAYFHDIALDLLKRYPQLALEVDYGGNTIFKTLAQKPRAFQSKTHLGWLQRYFYQTFPSCDGNVGDVENPCAENEKQRRRGMLFLVHIMGEKRSKRMLHMQAIGLVRLCVSQAVQVSNSSMVYGLLKDPLFIATKLGIHEIVVEIIKACPLLLREGDDNGALFFHLAVMHRQEKVYNLLYQMSPYKHYVNLFRDKHSNNLLHLAGKLALSNTIAGAALQMQRELQWFQEVENIVPPLHKEEKNCQGKTPTEIFTEEHKNLAEQGEKWMKETASSYAFVSALVATVAFAAAFTVPGGTNQQNGFPIFINETSFMIFAIANALALYSSSASLLMFLGILTCRYAEQDFLWALPMRLSIGLIALFLSIASMLVAYSASLYLLLCHRLTWILVPIGGVACVPIALFLLLQYPLLYEIVYSTFGPSIFGRQSEEKLM